MAGALYAYFYIAVTKATSQEITFAHAQIHPSSWPHLSAWPNLSITLCVLLTTCLSVGSNRDAFLNPNQSIKIAAGENSSYMLSVHVMKYAWSYKYGPVLPLLSGKKKKKYLVLSVMQFKSCLWKNQDIFLNVLLITYLMSERRLTIKK